MDQSMGQGKEDKKKEFKCSIEEVIALCRGAKVTNYKELDKNNIYENLKRLERSAKNNSEKEKSLQLFQAAWNALEGGKLPETFVYPQDINRLKKEIRLEGFGEGDINDTADKISKDSAYKYFFTRDEIVSILSGDDGADNDAASLIPDDLIEELNTFLNDEKKKKLIPKLNEILNSRPGGNPFLSYEDYDYGINDVCIDLLKAQQLSKENKPDPLYSFSMEVKEQLLPKIKGQYLDKSTNKEKSWEAVSYLLRYPMVLGPMLKIKGQTLDGEQADEWLSLLDGVSELNDINQTKKIVRILVPCFGIRLPKDKFKETNDDYGNDGYSDDPYRAQSQIDPIFMQSFNEAIDIINECINSSGLIPFKDFVSAVESLEKLRNKCPDEMRMVEKHIPDYMPKYQDMCVLINEFGKYYSQAKELDKRTEDALNEINGIFHRRIKPNKKQKIQFSEKYLELEKNIISFYGEEVKPGYHSDKPSDYYIMRSLQVTITERYSGTNIEGCIYDVINNKIPNAKSFLLRRPTALRNKNTERIKPIIILLIVFAGIW
nr:hypothetical protein [Lachnospiraceae bacterium]